MWPAGSPYWLKLAVLAALGAGLGLGCASYAKYEKFIAGSKPSPPPWIRATPPPVNGAEYFVGRSVAVNTLDERRALVRAKHDAAYDIAMSIYTEVHGTSRWIDRQGGDEARGVEEIDTEMDHQVTILVRQILTGLREIESYWEIWEVRDAPPRTPEQIFRRYKYYVLVVFPQAELERCREEVKKNARIKSIG